LPGLLADDAALARLDEGQLFGAECLRELGMLPSEYLSYYYFPQRQIQAVAAAGYTRAELLQSQQHAFYADEDATPDDALRAWQSLRAERDRSYMADARPRGAIPEELPPHDPTDGYAGVAVSVIEALENNAQARLIVNHANHGRLPFLADDVVVELPCQIGSSGIRGDAVADVPKHCRVLMQRVHAAEQAAVQASRTGSRRMAIEALALHPLVDSVELAQRIVAGYMEHQPGLAAQLA
jgi:6-phospho-beta-glucosidase